MSCVGKCTCVQKVLGVIFSSSPIENARRNALANHIAYIQTFPRGDILTETTPLAWATGQNKTQMKQRVHLIKSALYAGQTFYAFMLM